MRLAWATDIHLDFLDDEQVRRFAAELAAPRADALVLSGDLSHAETLEHHLRLLAQGVPGPIYFVLGNHDYYGSSVAAVRTAVLDLGARRPRLSWLPAAGVVRLTDRTGLIGCDGWADARIGNPATTPVVLNDFFHIEELADTLDPAARADPRQFFRGSDRGRLHAELRARGDAEAATLRPLLRDALHEFEAVVVVTHVPPFAEACWHDGRHSDGDWQPYFTCAAVGDVLRDAAAAWPGRQITVLCGHTHGAGEARILANLSVLTGAAEYRRPALQRVIDVA
ncbi:metallophosphoesterase family protein [Nannocystis bainbridge]|uniref:Metallophosphoesterase n=1 Tax=Nannocystis bainbridge TaxID=2995303 RepID=A0ABT5EC99_9BACT|nr:metallophosphoesterase [Nannocystis bainbridge]MDC0723503.1 metallophosphoesterase [Nannocystis bainbridge]